jgi:hypothetical protein
LRFHHLRDCCRVVETNVDRQAAAAREKGRKLVTSIANDRDAVRFELFER